MDDITMTAGNDRRYDVRQGKRLIGFACFVTIRGEGAWRFIANRKDIAARYPVPSPKLGSADEVLADVRARLGR